MLLHRRYLLADQIGYRKGRFFIKNFGFWKKDTQPEIDIRVSSSKMSLSSLVTAAVTCLLAVLVHAQNPTAGPTTLSPTQTPTTVAPTESDQLAFSYECGLRVSYFDLFF